MDVQFSQGTPTESGGEDENSILISLYRDIGGSRGFQIVDSIKTLKGKFFTPEQRKRDKQITRLLKCYVNTYERKSKSNCVYKFVIFWANIAILAVFSVACFKLLITYPDKRSSDAINSIVEHDTADADPNIIDTVNDSNVSNNMVVSDTLNETVALATACITYLTLVIGLMKIITKYVFPQKEEEYIARIVESVQVNDLANKKVYFDSFTANINGNRQNNQS